MVQAIERGVPQRDIAESAYRFQQEVERKERIVVGVNEFAESGPGPPLATLYVDETAGRAQVERLSALKARRDHGRVARALQTIGDTAGSNENLMPAFVEAARAYATVGEMCDILRRVWGEWVEAPVF
jgi:methylmalonyl-CoA mutase N-terminal domain/subunit